MSNELNQQPTPLPPPKTVWMAMGALLWWAVVGLVIGILVLLLMPVDKAHGHARDEILACTQNLVVEDVTFLGTEVYPNGLYAENYDRNGDDKTDTDITALSPITGYEYQWDAHTIPLLHAEHPILWGVDVDIDGAPDVMYRDTGGTGDCKDISVYEDQRQSPTNQQEEMQT